MYLEVGKFYETPEGKQFFVISKADTLNLKQALVCQVGYNKGKIDRTKLATGLGNCYDEFAQILNTDYGEYMFPITRECFMVNNFKLTSTEIKLIRRQTILENIKDEK